MRLYIVCVVSRPHQEFGLWFWHNVSLAKYIIHWWWSVNSSFFCCLTFCSLRDNKISAKVVCALVRVFQVNQSLQKLKLGWVQPFNSSFKACIYTETVVSLPVLCWNSLTLGNISMDGCVHSWLMITALIRASHLWSTTQCAYLALFPGPKKRRRRRRKGLVSAVRTCA